jgi:ABC-2 type transport system permease protein
VRRRPSRYLTAAHYLLIEQARNRLAIVLLIAFVPLWYFLVWSIVPSGPVDFRFRLTEHFIRVDGRELSLLTTGLNALTLIVGFIIFTATRRGMRFDHRLVLSGYPQWVVIAAKLTSLAVVALVVSLYTSGILLIFWQPQSLPIVVVSYAGAALAYGSLGLFLGVLLRGELEGFFLVIMVSLIDTFIQNPIGNPAANRDFVEALPTYAATQLYVAGGFGDLVPWRFIGLALVWPAALALFGLLIFWLRTRVPWARRAGMRSGLRGSAG